MHLEMLSFRADLDSWYNQSYTEDMKTAISLPDDLFRTAERVARSLGLSRSQLYQKALAAFLERYNDEAITDTLNKVYTSRKKMGLDPVLDQLQRASLPREDW